MRRTLVAIIFLALFPCFAWAESQLSSSVTSAMVLIANYNAGGTFLGWGSGFFVDDGIVVTNKHVIKPGDWYRVYGITADNAVDFSCFKSVTKSDLKINLNDDVAYIRAYLPCEHGKMLLAADPLEGDPISILGFPYKGSISASLQLSVSTGAVIGRTQDGWLSTDAHLDVGNSGGPVVNGTDVVGVAVAKGVDAEGNYLLGYFIPSSVILQGLLYANDSHFGYMPQSSISSRSRISSSSSSSISSVLSTSSVGSQGSRASSSSVSSRVPKETMPRTLQVRTCERVMKWFARNATVLDRVNARLKKRFGFECG